MKPFTRYFLYYLIGRAGVTLLTTFIFTEMWFRGFIQSYRRYLILVSLSYFTYCYVIDETEKSYLHLKTTLFLFNLYLALHLFFRPLLNIESVLFLLLGGILLGLRAIRKLPFKIKWPLYFVWGIASVLILISGIFYLYPHAPDVEGFIQQQPSQLILTSPTQQAQFTAYITLVNLSTHKQQTFLFQTWTQFIVLPETYQISYVATTPDNEAQVFIIFPDATLFQILPQSTMYVQNEITPETWTFLRHQSLRTGLLEDISRVWKNRHLLLPLMSQETYENVTSFYRTTFTSYLIEQIGSPFIASPVMQQINKTVLMLLSKVFPWFFSQNLDNYYKFQTYFSFTHVSEPSPTNKYTLSQSIESDSNLRESIKKNVQLSFPNLRVF